MKHKKQKRSREETIALYNSYVPAVSSKIKSWNTDAQGLVVLCLENKGIMNTILQKLLHKPRLSYVHLDETGSYIWQRIDGQANVEAIAASLRTQFGDRIEPLYERLLRFFEIVESYDFITWQKPYESKEMLI